MELPGRRATILRASALVFVVAAVAYSARTFWTNVAQPGTGEKDAVTLVCAKCDQESVLPSAEYQKLARDPATGLIQCPKCGEKAARIASIRCPHCKRAIPTQPPGAPMICPFCKASLLEDDEGDAQPEKPVAEPESSP
jgi:DNA-directed RNA polymerase subunit RPC12/RpoP